LEKSMETIAESASSAPGDPSKGTRSGAKGHAPFFGPLPTRGIWTAVGLTRGQFFFILTVSVAMFVFLYGPLWLHARDSHLARIVWSYLVIVPMVWAALYRSGKARVVTVVAASVVVGLVKLVLTAVILVAIGLLQA